MILGVIAVLAFACGALMLVDDVMSEYENYEQGETEERLVGTLGEDGKYKNIKIDDLKGEIKQLETAINVLQNDIKNNIHNAAYDLQSKLKELQSNQLRLKQFKKLLRAKVYRAKYAAKPPRTTLIKKKDELDGNELTDLNKIIKAIAERMTGDEKRQEELLALSTDGKKHIKEMKNIVLEWAANAKIPNDVSALVREISKLIKHAAPV